MCVNTAKIEAINDQLKALREERTNYQELLDRCNDAWDTIDCIREKLESIGLFCGNVRASGPYDLGKSTEYAESFQCIEDEMDERKDKIQLSLDDIDEEIDVLEIDKSILALHTPCGSCEECCPPPTETSQSSNSDGD